MEGSVYSVFIDIDGTLISEDNSGPFKDDISGIEKARQRGAKIFLSTGRSLAQIPKQLADASWKDGVVAAGGAHVILGEKTIYHNWAPISVLCEVAGLFLETGKKCGFRGDNHTYVVNRNAGIDSGKLPVMSAADFSQKYVDARVSMLTVDHSIGNKERALLEKYFDIYIQIPHLDCFIKGEGKAKGMKLVLDTLALDRENSIAIGDSSNDMDIIEYAGTGIAVGNACNELKEKASWISSPVGEGAVVKALEHCGLC